MKKVNFAEGSIIAIVIYLLMMLSAESAFTQLSWVRIGTQEYRDAHAISASRYIAISRDGWVIISDTKGMKWRRVLLQKPYSLNEIHFTDSLHGAIVGDSGTVLTTSDAGENWRERVFPSKQHIISIENISQDTMLVCTNEGELYISPNKGEDWEMLVKLAETSLNSIAIFNNVIIVVGDSGKVFRNRNSILQWDTISTSTANDLHCCSLSGTSSIAVGNKGTIILSKDGGNSWDSVFSDISFDLYTSVFVSDSSLLCMGSKGYQVLSTDRGTNWSKKQVNDTTFAATYYSIIGEGDSLLAVGNECAIFMSNDAAKTWSTISHMPFPYQGSGPNHFGNIYFFNNSGGYFCAGDGEIYKTIDNCITWHLSAIIQRYVDIQGMMMFNDTSGFVIGSVNGVNEYTYNGGRTWNLPPNEAFFGYHTLYDLQFVSNNNGFVLADSILFITSDGARSWQMKPLPTKYPWRLSFIDTNYGFYCGSLHLGKDRIGSIHKTTNGGTTWQLVHTTDSMSYYGLKMVDKQLGFACGEKGIIVKTTDGGENWVKQNSFTTKRLLDINFINDTIGFAVGDGFVVLSTFDGGEHWVTEDFSSQFPGAPSIYGFASVQFSDSETVFICGAEKAIYYKKIYSPATSSVETSNVIYNPFLEIVSFPTPALENLTVSLRGLFSIPNEYVRLSLYDVMGRNVKTLFEGMLPEYTVKHIDMNFKVNTIPSGVYYVHLESSSSACLTKIIISK